MKVELTAAYIRSISASPNQRIEISDTTRIGLRFRMSPKGKATWIYQKKIKNGSRRGFALGTYPDVSLAQARLAALEIQIVAERGMDPIQNAKDELKFAAEQKLREKTVEDVLTVYINTYVNQELKYGKSRAERKQQLMTYLKPYYNLHISGLTRSQLQPIIDIKQAEGKIIMANRIRAAIRAFIGWAYKRGHISKDIGALLQSAGKEKARERTPTLVEVKTIWAASMKMGELWGPFIRLCILTGQRCRSDVLMMEWAWLDFSRTRYEIPNPKNGRPHIVHLSPAALRELNSLQKSQTSNYVFSTTNKTPASGVSKAKRRLDEHIKEIWVDTGHTMSFEPWVMHDLRRSQATALAEAGFDEGVVDRIQNHVASGSRASAVAAVYNKAQKLTERALALDAWAEMITGNSSNVVKLKKA